MAQSIIAIQGKHLDKVAKIFGCFKYQDLAQDMVFDNAETFNEYLFDNYFDLANQEIALRGLWVSNGWTIISDPEMVDTFDEDPLLKINEALNAEILTFIIQTTSGSFGFAKYDKTKLRNFFASGGEVMENFGSALAEEQGLQLNEQVLGDDILKLASHFGIDLEGNSSETFLVKHFGYNEELKKELAQFKSAQTKDQKKPWWKFW